MHRVIFLTENTIFKNKLKRSSEYYEHIRRLRGYAESHAVNTASHKRFAFWFCRFSRLSSRRMIARTVVRNVILKNLTWIGLIF